MSKFVGTPRVIGRWTATRLGEIETLRRDLEAARVIADTAIATLATFTASNSAAASSAPVSISVDSEEAEWSAVAKPRKVKSKKVMVKPTWVKKAWSPTLEIGRPAEAYPTVPAEIRAHERTLLSSLTTAGPLLVYGRLFSATVNGKRENIPAVIEEDGTFGYMSPEKEYVTGLHSFELIWHFRRDYDLSGTVKYEDYIRCKQYFHCLLFVYFDGQKRHSVQKTVHKMLDEKKLATATAPVIVSNSSSSNSSSSSSSSRAPPGLSRPPPGLSRSESDILPPSGPLHLSGLL